MVVHHLSIVIIATKRKTFLIRAVSSVLHQTLPRSSFEVITIKNFKDKEIDRFLHKNRITTIYSRDETLSGKIITAVKRSSGDIIVFLEDDDEFIDTKLERVYEIFKDNRIGFYNNNLEYINESGNPINELKVTEAHRPIVIKNDEKVSRFNEFVSRSIRNNSSMAILKSLILTDNLSKMDRKSIDWFFLFTALSSNKDIYIDNRILTRYRVHDNQDTMLMSPTDIKGFASRKLNISIELIDSYLSILNILRTPLYSSFIQNKISRERVDAKIFSRYLSQRLANRYLVTPYDYIRALLPPTDLPLTERLQIISASLLSILFNTFVTETSYRASLKRNALLK